MVGAPIPFLKFSAAGNDFALVQERDLGGRLAAALAVDLCRRRRSLGADGLVVWRLVGPARVAVAHYEPNGERTFCLNALRGVASWLRHTGRWQGDCSLWLEEQRGPVEARPGEPPALGLPPPRLQEPRQVTVEGRRFAGIFLDVGNPQFVVPLADPAQLEAPDLMDWGRRLRWCLPAFPEGTNVDFVVRRGDEVLVRTFERGVEAETLSCGSGIVASACALSGGEAGAPDCLRFQTRGGEEVRVQLERQGGSLVRIWSAGPVEFVARGELLAA